MWLVDLKLLLGFFSGKSPMQFITCKSEGAEVCPSIIDIGVPGIGKENWPLRVILDTKKRKLP